MLSKRIVDMLNSQINKEFYSAYLYLEISVQYYDMGLDGFGNWYKIQAKEEMAHAELFLQYLQNNDGKVSLDAIEKPKADLAGDARNGMEMAYNHEKFITSTINDICTVAFEEKDYRTLEFLNWFVKEQGEEEKNAAELIRQYDIYGKDNRALFMLDRELAQRTFSPPSLVL